MRRLGFGVYWVCAGGVGLVGACGDDGSGPSISTGASQGNTSETTSGTSTGAVDSSSSSTGFDTYESAEGTGTTAGPMVTIDCAEPPPAAVSAEYDHQLQATGFPGGVTWQMQGLPPGTTFSPLTGAISGAPEQAGSFDVEVTAMGSGSTAMQICTIEVGEGLSVDLSGLARPCIGPDDDLLDFVMGGDGAAITCHTPGGNGNGALPDGVSVDERSCGIVGDPDDTYGTWVWMTELRQSGHRVWVPYCVTELDQVPNAYVISGDHSGGTDNVLDPAVGTFAPGQPLDWGGSGDPLFTVLGPCGANSCYYGYAYHIGASPFGNCANAPCFGLTPSALVRDANDAPIGFSHELFAKGPAVSEAFEQRSFVLGWELDYCIADDDQTCDGVQNIEQNGNGHLRFGLIMIPQ